MPVPHQGASAPSTTVLHKAINGSGDIGGHLFRKYYPELLKAARRRAPHLAPDLHDEIVSETWSLVMDRGIEAFEQAGVGDAAYLHTVLRNAVEVVKANNRPPGTKSRATSSDFRDCGIDLLAEDEGKLPASVQQALGHGSRDVEESLHTALDLEFAVRRLPRPDQQAVAFLLENGTSLSAAAESAGLTRQTFVRHLAAARVAA